MESGAAETAPATIESLPAELLHHVLSFLDGPAPSAQRLHDQPHVDMLRRADPPPHSRPLQTASLVNKQWRATVLPLLFRNAIWYLDRSDLHVDDHLRDSPSLVPLLPFLLDNSLASYVRSLTLVVRSSTRTTTPGDAPDVGLYRRGDGSGHYGYSPEPHSPPSPRHRGGERDLIFNEDSNWLWRLVFAVISPLRFTIVASPRMLASLLARKVFLGDEWVFDQSHHVLSLSRDDPRGTARAEPTATTSAGADSAGEQAPEPPHTPAAPRSPRPASSSSSSGPLARPTSRVPCKLFTVRPWTRLLLNEGSSTRVYKTYEYFHKRPPSVLAALLGAGTFPNDEALVPPSVRDLSYVAIFPLSGHFATLVDFLPPLDRLFVQIVPRNDILQDRHEMAHLDIHDLWAERNTSYVRIMPMLFDGSDDAGNWRHLEEFETGDAADRESWEMAVDYVSTMEQFAKWRVEREGVFARRHR